MSAGPPAEWVEAPSVAGFQTPVHAAAGILVGTGMIGPRRNASGVRSKGQVVLLVLREPEFRRRLAEVLASNGYMILEAGDWPSAVGKALTLSPDAIALEVSLLAPGGSEVARALRSHERTAHIPILALSDRSWRPSTLRTMGFDRILSRPCSESELLEAFASLFEPHDRARHGGRC